MFTSLPFSEKSKIFVILVLTKKDISNMITCQFWTCLYSN